MTDRNDYNQWCLSSYSDIMELSYSIDQNAQPTYWQMQIKPTISTQFALASNFEIARIVQQTWDFELKPFKADVYYSFLFS